MMLLRSAFRSLCAHPLFSTLTVALLALGLGANTAIFSVVHAVLLKPLPYPQSGELVLIRKPVREAGAQVPGGGDLMPDTEFASWQEATPKSFRALAAYRNASVTFQRGDGAVRTPAAAVTGDFFPLLGVTPWRGRLFSAADLAAGAPSTAVLSFSVWQSRFNGNDDALGAVVKLDDVPTTIIGVLPPAFEFVDPVDFWRPLSIPPSAPGQLRIQLVRVFGRVRSGTSREVAQGELDGISARFWSNLPAFGPPPGAPSAGGPRVAAGPGPRPPRIPFADAPAQLVPLQEQLARQSRATLWLLLGAVAAVLLIACANIASLQLARATARKRDVAVRAALGASPVRLAGELLVENLLLAFAGAALGVLLAWAGTHALQGWLATYLPRINPIGLDSSVLLFAAALATLAGLGFGLAPAWCSSRVDLLETLKEGGHQSASVGHRRRQLLVSVEIALALVLAINTGLLVKSIRQLHATELGYRTSDVLTANLSLPRRYGSPAQQRDFASRWLDAMQTLPGVKQAALTDAPPLSPYQQVVLAAQGPQADASVSAAPPTMAIASISADYFRAVGIPLREGRFFDGRDGEGATSVAIVNEEFVRQFYPATPALGATVILPPTNGPAGAHGGPPATATIVGIVANSRPRGFETAPQPLAFFPIAQQPRARLAAVLQFEGEGEALPVALTAITHKIDADLALDQPQTLEQQLARQTAPRRATTVLTGVFAAVAVALAALGVFGVTSYTVAQRRREIGVRMALGAEPRTILRWMLHSSAVSITSGLVAGLALNLAASRLLPSLLVGVAVLDPTILLIGVLSLALIGFASCLLPALRATRVNPVDVLRSE